MEGAILELRELRYFLAVAEDLHFHHAADHLNVAQPALSQAIKRLEVKLGFQLFERSTRSVRLTPAGIALVADARRVVSSANKLAATASAIANGGAGALSIGYGVHIHETAAELIGSFARAQRGVALSHRQGYARDLIGEVEAGRIDVALMLQRPLPESLAFERLAEMPLVALVPPDHPLATHTTIQLEELVEFRIPVMKYGDLRTPLEYVFSKHSLRPHFAMIDDSVSHFPMQVLKEPDYVTVLTAEYPHPEAKELSFDPPVTCTMGIVWRAEDLSATARAFRTFAKRWSSDRCEPATSSRDFAEFADSV